MIIRSQDKNGIINFNNIDTICIEKKRCDSEVVCFNGSKETKSKLGEYTTYEKAIKVLDDICTFANGIHFEKIATDQCGRLDGVVFQMPQDSEV